MAFKGESDDSRGSLSFKLWEILEHEAGSVLCTDPFVQHPDFLPVEQVVARSRILIVGAPPIPSTARWKYPAKRS